MGLRELEAGILAELRTVERNPKIRQADIAEWSTGEVKPHDGEKVVFLPQLKINVALKVKA